MPKIVRKNTNVALGVAKKKQDNEFYTREVDIAKELPLYKEKLKGKVVYCNCDNPEWSKFWKYLHQHFAEFGLKKLVSTHFEVSAETYLMEYEGGNDEDITVGIKTPLLGNGDYRSDECLAILDKCDVVITNPPFSIIRDYLAVLLMHHKEYLFIGPITCYSVAIFSQQLITNAMQVGYHPVETFYLSGGGTSDVQCRWYSNIAQERYSITLPLSYHYYDSSGVPFFDVTRRYPKYDDVDAIDVTNLGTIPVDYMGVMGVPITFLDRYSPRQFKILAVCRPFIKGKPTFSRFMIKRVEACDGSEADMFTKKELEDDFFLHWD